MKYRGLWHPMVPAARTGRRRHLEEIHALLMDGYKRIAVMCRRAGQAVADRHAYVLLTISSASSRPSPQAKSQSRAM